MLLSSVRGKAMTCFANGDVHIRVAIFSMRRCLNAMAIAFVVIVLVQSPAHAQSVPPPATNYTIDSNGVDVIAGQIFLQSPSISVGQPGMGGLSYQRTYDSSIKDWRNNVTGSINSSGSVYTVTLMGVSESFTLSGGVYTENEGRGGTLSVSAGVYTYTRSDGAVGSYSTSLAGTQPVQANVARITALTMPSGEALTFTYTTLTGAGFSAQRLQSVTNNLGYQLSFTYQSSSADATGITLTKVTAINNAVEYCSPTANGCTLSGTWPSLTFATVSLTQTVTDSLSRQWQYTIGSDGRVYQIFWPGGALAVRTIIYDASGFVQTVRNGLINWSYSFSTVGTTRTLTTTTPAGVVHTYVSNTSTNRLTSYTETSHTTSYTYDSQGRLTRAALPEGNYTNYTLDSRGNVTETRLVAKSGSGLSDIVATAAFPSSCTATGITPATCNEPTSTTDPRGFRTDYTYDSTHGGPLTVTQPASSGSAPVGSGARPQTRYGYTQLYAWYKNSGGSIVQAATPVYRLTSTSACATSSSCAGGSDESVSSISYGVGSSIVASNLLPVSTSAGAGDGSLTATAQTTYDDVSNVASVQGPLGSTQTIVFHYDANRERTGIVGPDPDGGGSLLNRAVRYTYDGLGQVTKLERGTVPSQSNADWASFSAIEEIDNTYDPDLPHLIRRDFMSGGTTYNVAQYTYDNDGRPACMIQRMNPQVFGSLPTDCSASTTGANGPDRIFNTAFLSGSDRLSGITGPLYTSLSVTSPQYTYTANGQVTTVQDANGNLTTYEYDGLDRLSKIRFPNTSGGGSSTTDYEQYSYDANSNVTADRRRDGTTISNTYDNLNRITLADAPSGTADVSYTYDLFGRMLTAGISGQTLTYTYDQLSRNLSEANSALSTTVSYQYDLAGQRTRVTWPDTLYVQYDYDNIGEVTAIRENGATSGAGVLASYAYNNLGQRTSITRGNGVTSTYSYDGAQRLSSLAHDLASTGSDQTLSYTYAASNQQLTRTGTNASYAYAPPTGYLNPIPNGLNQYTSLNATSTSYDTRGNLTSDGATTYTYDAYNRLTGAGSATLSYDPAGRLYQTAGASTTRFLYDGAEAIAEYNSSGTMLRRFVHGPDIDEPIVWYEGSGTTDRRWLIANELHSIIAVTNSSGAASSINSYDEYGVPASGNTGRFQYTGQMWLPEASLYHYRARAYSATLARFMQTDPSANANLYAYVNNDPVNAIDPTGADAWLLSRSATDPFPALAGHLFGAITGMPTTMVGAGPHEAYLVPGATTRLDLGAFTAFADNNFQTGTCNCSALSLTNLGISDADAISAAKAVSFAYVQAHIPYNPLTTNSNQYMHDYLTKLGLPDLVPPGKYLFGHPGYRPLSLKEEAERSSAHMGIFRWNTNSTMLDAAMSLLAPGGFGQAALGGFMDRNSDMQQTDPEYVSQEQMRRTRR
jgi:RHS repeat-associated protein